MYVYVNDSSLIPYSLISRPFFFLLSLSSRAKGKEEEEKKRKIVPLDATYFF